MKVKTPILYLIIFMCALGINSLHAQKTEKVSITADKADITFIAPNAYILEIGSSNGYYFKQEVAHTNKISISNVDATGKKFEDGNYLLQVTPIFTLSDTERKELKAIRSDQKKMAAYRLAHNLPEVVEATNVYFSIRNGEFVSPDQKEIRGLSKPKMAIADQDHPSLYASLNYTNTQYTKPIIATKSLPNATDNTTLSEDAQVFTTDLIVQGSFCLGVDCATTENFSFDTQRLKENNLRIHFEDTSGSASFPGNDWRITINDSSNGGANYFAIEDATAGKIPFRIMAGAPANSLYVNDAGNVGIGTASPIVEAHITDGDSPTLRLEQNGSSGFGSQTWDIAGNETNFFIRDVTNGSLLPFRIKPSAPKNSLFIDSDGDIGLGTESPTSALHIESGDVYVKAGNLGINKIPINNYALDVMGDFHLEGASVLKGDIQAILSSKAVFYDNTFMSFFTFDAVNKRVGIGLNTDIPATTLDVNGGIRSAGFLNVTNPDDNVLMGAWGHDGNLNAIRYVGNSTNSALMTLANNSATQTIQLNSNGSSFFAGGNLGLGSTATNPGHLLELSVDDAVKPNGGSWSAPSDRRLKTNIRDFNEGLDQILQIRPVKYNYNGKLGYPTEPEFIGVIAQDMKKIAPYTIKDLNHNREEENYLAFDPSALTYLLVNAVQEQQVIIDAQQKEIAELQKDQDKLSALQAQIDELSQMVSSLKETGNSSAETVGEKK